MSKKTPSPDDLLEETITSNTEDLLVEDNEDFELDDVPEMEEGTYVGISTDFEKTTSSTGNGQFKIVFKLPTLENQKQTTWLSLTPQARFRLVPQLKALGIEPDPTTKKLKVNRDLVVGKVVQLVFKKRTYQGNTRVQIDNIIPATQDQILEYSDTPVV
jgi:hypothetical protein